jgi:serine/threonine-protein kinase
MTPERWRQVTQAFHAALAREASARTSYLDQACAGDRPLREEIDAMLSAHADGAPVPAIPVDASLTHTPRLLSGTVIGPYRVTELIGAGGMGEVYRARDTKLGRDVAVKVLPAAFTSDADRLARFEREARVLATLNHPHIGAIYGLEEADASAGSGQAGVRALVLELVEGETLAERLAVGPLPIQEALTVARQIADALEAAHEKGIVHRDLKPGNIKITPDGAVKVLDFGLAKAAAGDASGSDLSQSPSISIGGTREGVILGTAAYMSPEQARGQQIDKRTDMWAFGCVLYEMLTGKRAFDGEDLTEVLGAVVRLDPDWDAVPPDVALPVRTLLRICLTKDPRKRKIEATTALFVLDNTASLADISVSHGATDARREWARSSRRNVVLSNAAAVVVTGAIVGAAVWWTMRPASPGVFRTEVTTSGATALTIGGVDRDLAITPDGSRIIYRGANQLLVRALEQLEPDVLSGLGAPRGVFVSPDGQWVGFFDGNSLLKKVAMAGGPPLTITRTDGSSPAEAPRGATWGPDGTIVYATNAPATGLLRVSAAGGDPTVLTKPNRERGESDHLWPEFLPGGQAALFTITAAGLDTITAATGGLDNAQIAVLELETGTYKVLVRGGSHAHYVPTGHLVYGAGDKLRAVAFDLDRLEAVGTPVTVLEHVATTAQGAVDAAIAANGTMAYIPWRGAQAQETVVVWVDRQLREEPTKIPPGLYLHPRLSPDGQKVALSAFRADGSDVWVYDFRRATFTRLTFEGNNNRPVWTPDGARIAFSSSRAGVTPNIYWLPVDGSAAAERLTTGPFNQVPEGWAPDGKTLMFSEFRPDSGWDIWTLSAADRKPQLFLRTPFNDGGRAFSPDGRWLAYYSDESGRGEVQVRPFPGPGPKWQISTEGGAEPVWAPSGRELFYRSENRLMVADVQLVPAFSARAPRLLFEGEYKTSLPANFDVSPDGRRFIMIKPAATADARSRLVVVQNWTEELKRLVPTK